MEHMLSESQPLDFYLSIDVIISKVSFVKTICKPFQIHGCLSWLRKSWFALSCVQGNRFFTWTILKWDLFLKAFMLR